MSTNPERRRKPLFFLLGGVEGLCVTSKVVRGNDKAITPAPAIIPLSQLLESRWCASASLNA